MHVFDCSIKFCLYVCFNVKNWVSKYYHKCIQIICNIRTVEPPAVSIKIKDTLESATVSIL